MLKLILGCAGLYWVGKKIYDSGFKKGSGGTNN